MKLIQEADKTLMLDENVNKQLIKIQDAIAKLEVLVQDYNEDFKPVRSTIRAIEYSAEDLTKLANKLRSIS